jgi:phosphocarrier protein HPr
MNLFGQKQQPSELPSITREFVLSNKLGMHARPAALFVKTASKFTSEIMVEKDGEEVNGKSIMGLMMLAAGFGSVLKINATGVDASEALDEIAKIFERKFDEE